MKTLYAFDVESGLWHRLAGFDDTHAPCGVEINQHAMRMYVAGDEWPGYAGQKHPDCKPDPE